MMIYILTMVSWAIAIFFGVRHQSSLKVQRTLYESVYKTSSTITDRLLNLLAKANEAGTPPEIIARIDEIRINMASFNHTIYLIRKQLWHIKEEEERGQQESQG